MKQKWKASLLLLIFSLTLISQAAQAATYYVNSPEEEIIQFNRAMALHDKDITIEYNTEVDGYYFDLYKNKYALQDYVASDYAYFNEGSVNIRTTQSYSNGKNVLKLEYIFEGLETPEETNYVFDTIHNLIKKNQDIIKASDYEKAAWVYDYIINHVTYDYSYSKYSAYEALHDGTAVCQGYSLLYYAMAKELGLNCKIVSGLADNGREIGSHAWNMLELEGKWYCVDSTWGAGTHDRTYFLIPKQELKSHFFDSIYENYFDYATTNYVDIGNSGYHGVLASVYNVTLDPLRKIELTKEVDAFIWLLSNPDRIPLTFSSDNPMIAEVDEEGLIQSVGIGTTNIRVTNEELGIEQVCEVKVTGLKPLITDYQAVKVSYNKKQAIKLVTSPSNAAMNDFTYESKNKSIATVSSKGVVTGKRAGNTIITVTYRNNQKVEIPVTVTPVINSKYKSVSVKIKKTVSIKNAVTVSDKGYQDLIFKSTNGKIAKVSTSGTVTGVKKGSCTIKIYDKATNKLVAKVAVKVK